MFVVVLTYTAPLERIDELLPQHRAWLDRNYAAGVLLLSGARVPRTGGVLLARAVDREELDAVLAGDPFARAGAAEYQVVEFTPSGTAPELAFLRQPPAS
ncbi:YciI family protein [Streptacidiphilus carbonis]|uniref:YciI family protein n=1 Tax=Streptacidiphilus carbonis TaxID=105422 RepID=UPI0005A9FC40|nr:YciI family protein [Streptacidiphilus carbonis]